MCWFLTLGVPHEGVAAIEALSREGGGFRLRRPANGSLSAIFPAADTLFEVTHGQCSCDLMERETPDDDERLRRQYARRGWTASRIERALEERQRARERFRQGRKHRAQERLRAVIQEQAKRPGGIRVFAHYYRGLVDDEVLAAARTRRVSSDEFVMSHVDEDVLIDIGEGGAAG